ncbi:MAG: hypothetical protein WAW88_04610, partial [Nocardioides sp.]
VGGLGALVAAYGGWLVVSASGSPGSVAGWLVAGPAAHDLLLVPVALLLVRAGRRLPHALRAPAAVLLVVLGSVTLVAVPVLGRFGDPGDNATVLDRDYGAGLLLVATLTLALTIVSVVAMRLRGSHGARARRR